MKTALIPLLEKGPGREAAKRHCRQLQIPISVIERLVEAELEQVGKLKKHGIQATLHEILTNAVEERNEG